MRVAHNNYGFVWGEVLVERTASQDKNPYFQVLRVFAPNGEVIEITMRKRKTDIRVIPREKP